MQSYPPLSKCTTLNHIPTHISKPLIPFYNPQSMLIIYSTLMT